MSNIIMLGTKYNPNKVRGIRTTDGRHIIPNHGHEPNYSTVGNKVFIGSYSIPIEMTINTAYQCFSKDVATVSLPESHFMKKISELV